MRRDCACPRAQHRHGTRRAYECDRCRCLPCRAAHASSVHTYRHGGTWREDPYVDATGTRRRLQALAAAGVTSRQVAAHTGLSVEMASYLRSGRHAQITPRLAALVIDTYEALWDKSRGDSNSRRCSTQALTLGYAPPLAWDDDEIDNPAARPNTSGTGRWDLKPCGTTAAVRRHYRRREPLDAACRAASRRERAERRTVA